MESYKRYFIFLFSFLFVFLLSNDIHSIHNLSMLDFCKMQDSEAQMSLGFQKNHTINSYYLSMDKIISHNLIGAARISLLRYDELEIYSQNSLISNFKYNPLDFIISINYLSNDFKINKWLTIGCIYNLFKRYYSFNYNFFIGTYYDVGINNEDKDNFNYYMRIEKQISKYILASLSSRYNSSFNQFNNNFELIIKI